MFLLHLSVTIAYLETKKPSTYFEEKSISAPFFKEQFYQLNNILATQRHLVLQIQNFQPITM